MSQPASRRLYLIDGSSQMYRAYHAFRAREQFANKPSLRFAEYPAQHRAALGVDNHDSSRSSSSRARTVADFTRSGEMM